MTFFIAIVPLYGSNIIFDWFGFIFTKFAFSSCQLSKEFKVDNKILLRTLTGPFLTLNK